MTAARTGLLLSGTLTQRFAQNNTEIDGLGCHQVNFASAEFSLEHFSIRQECVRVKLGRCGVMNELTLNGDFLVHGLVASRCCRAGIGPSPKPPAPTIKLSDAFTSRALRGRKE